MINKEVDIVVVGAGPVGLMCSYLGEICGLNIVAVDKNDGALKVGRADALNARTLQLLELAGLFKELYPKGKICNTSSVWSNGRFISRQSSWWDEIEGCFHKHFLMLGQSHIEKLLDQKLNRTSNKVLRKTEIENIVATTEGCLTTLSTGEVIKSKFVIGADGSRSFVRNHFKIPFELIRPKITWAVIDGVVDTDFKKVPEIVVFQAETSDVAWIPREGEIDRFYVRMDRIDFTQEEVLEKINNAIFPNYLTFKEVEWFSHFSVKESVAESFCTQDRVFLAGDSCHVHSVNGGQGLNTGLADAFNLIWKLNLVLKGEASSDLLNSYESERRPVAQSVIESSGELVRATKFSERGTHAQDYVKIVEKRSGNITGMGIRYGESGLRGTRVFDFEIFREAEKTRLYSLLDYRKYTLLICGDVELPMHLPERINCLKVKSFRNNGGYWSKTAPYHGQALLIRPDSYIEYSISLEKVTYSEYLAEMIECIFPNNQTSEG
ncbi:MAG: hypothetical protein CMJ16_08065 [Peredibacter sp.]|nr:hypothetical protein [Peredibacter sp.]